MKRIFWIFIFIIFYNVPDLYPQIAVALHTAGEGEAREVIFYYRSDGFQQAYAEAVDGDTIYLPGGSFNPPTRIEKRLVIYGAGHYPSATAATSKTVINGTLTLDEGADNLRLEGLYVSGGLTVNSDRSVNQVTIQRCFFTQRIHFYGSSGTNVCRNFTFKGCVFSLELYSDNLEQSAVYNSFLGGQIRNSTGNLFSNNIVFYSTPSNYNSGVFAGGEQNIIENNIFRLNTSRFIHNSSNNTFTNNVFHASSPYYGTGAQVYNSWTDVDFSSLFEFQEGAVFSYDHDYTLRDSGAYTGTDETQVGIYGGVFPYKENAVPVIPHIISRSVSPRTDSDGNLSIEITVEAQNEN